MCALKRLLEIKNLTARAREQDGRRHRPIASTAAITEVYLIVQNG